LTSGFEPPPPAWQAGFPSFRPLFEGNRYLELLHLPSERQVFQLVEDAAAASDDVDRELEALFLERNWRCHLVAAASLLATGAGPRRLDALWGAITRGTWIAPQLVATAWLLDADFEERARKLILADTWPKTLAALGALYRQLPAPRLTVLAQLSQWASRKREHDDEDEARDGELYVREWLAKLNGVATEPMRARWRRPPP
jgi:hypothetical protein